VFEFWSLDNSFSPVTPFDPTLKVRTSQRIRGVHQYAYLLIPEY